MHSEDVGLSKLIDKQAAFHEQSLHYVCKGALNKFVSRCFIDQRYKFHTSFLENAESQNRDGNGCSRLPRLPIKKYPDS